MAEDNDEDLELELADAGVSFRAEMWATNFFMGYWKHVLAGLITLLLSVLFFGQYQTYVQRVQRSTAAHIATIERDLPGPVISLSAMRSQGNIEATDEVLCKAGDELAVVGDGASGPSSVEAYLKASELFRLCADPAKRRAVLEKAVGQGGGVLDHAVVAALANLDLEEDRGDQAVERFTSLRDENTGFLAEQAAIDLGLALEHLGRVDEAQSVYADFLTKWPDSPRADQVRGRQAPASAATNTPEDPPADDGEAG